MKRILVNQVREGPSTYFSWSTSVIFVLLLVNVAFRFSILHSNELFLKNKDVWYQLLRKYFHLLFIKSSLLVLISYLFFQCFLFFLAFITSTLVTSQSYSLLFCFATALPLWGGLFTPLSQISFSFHRSPFHRGPLLLFTSSPHTSAWPSFSWFPFITSSVLTRCHP